MPIITIKTYSNDKMLDLKVIAKNISEKSGFEIGRLTLMAHYPEQNELYNISKSPMVVHIEICERNGKDAIHKLMKASHSVIADVTKLSKEDIIVYCHPIPNEYLIVKDGFI